MLKHIDHIVIVVRDLETAMNGAREAGFTVLPGGTHAGGETHNALVAFADGTYLELLAFCQADPKPGHYFSERHHRGPGLAEFALLTDDIDREVSAIGERGVVFPIPTHLGRTRPDGELLEWRMSLPAAIHPGKGLPFLMEDTTDRELRVPCRELETTHPNGAIGVAGISVVVPDLEAAAPEYRAILDTPQDRDTIVGLAGKGILRLDVPGNSGHWVALIQALPGSAPSAYLQRFGIGPYAVTLRRDRESDVHPGDGELIDPALMSEARFYL
jgi:hypothetical protein